MAPSTEDDIKALDDLCDRLAGFAPEVTLERLDGALAALIAGPADLAQSMQTVMKRWNAIAGELAPQALFDEPDRLRLMPLIDEFDPSERDELLAEGKIDADEAAAWPLTGEEWAVGFLEVVDRLAQDWRLPLGAAADELQRLLRPIQALTERDETKLRAALRSPGQPPSRDDLIDDACFAAAGLGAGLGEAGFSPASRPHPNYAMEEIYKDSGQVSPLCFRISSSLTTTLKISKP